MIYREFQNLKLSALGMGAMRLPVLDGRDDQVDEAAVAEMVAYAMEHGINYYDTAWGYHAGHSGGALGRALAAYPQRAVSPGRPSSRATTWPIWTRWRRSSRPSSQRCGVTYFDFYLFHNVCEMNIDAYLDPRYGILDYLLEQKKKGRIRHLGFSVHGALPVMRRFLEAYGSHHGVLQVQLNYVDWTFQDAKAKVELLREYRIPVWVMEPLRGGRLARLSEEEARVLRGLRPEEEIPAGPSGSCRASPA